MSGAGRVVNPTSKKIPGSSSSASVSDYMVDRDRTSSQISPVDIHDNGRDHGRDGRDVMDHMGDSIEEDDLFFSNESFDDLRAQAAENGNSDASGVYN